MIKVAYDPFEMMLMEIRRTSSNADARALADDLIRTTGTTKDRRMDFYPWLKFKR